MQTDQAGRNFIEAFPAGMATFTMHSRWRLLFANQGFFSLMGYPETQYRKLFGESNALSVCSEDLYKVKNRIKKNLLNQEQFQLIYQHRLPDGSVRWILLKARREEQTNAEPIYYGVFSDVTGLEENRRQLRLTCDRFQQISHIAEEMLFEYDIQTKSMMQTMSASFSADLSFRSGRIEAYCDTILHRNVVHPEDVEIFIGLCKAFNRGAPELDEQIRFRSGEHTYVWCRIQAKTVYDELKRPLKVIGKIVNIDCEKKENERLRDQARRDSLTGFYHKTAVQELAEAFLAGEGATGIHALLIVDIDHFKAINDYLGHLFGDAVLTEIAAEIRRHFMPQQLVGRVGGDEFVILLKDIISAEAVKKAALSICDIFCRAYAGERGDYKISCSIGIALYPDHGTSYKTLFRLADIALYAAKNNGRGNYRLYDQTLLQDVQKNDGDGLFNVYQWEEPKEGIGRRSKQMDSIAIFELLFETKDIRSGIQMVLRMIGKQYGISRVYIVEESSSGMRNRITYEWCNEGVASRTQFNGETPYHRVQKKAPYYVRDIEELEGYSSFKEYLRANGVKSMLRYTICENGVFNGMIGFDECSRIREWKEDEIDSLILAAKFIGSFLVKRQAQDEIEKLAYTDPLTGLWNLNKFKLKAQSLLKQLNAEPETYALICFDVEKFRYINDTFGFDTGDEIIKFIAYTIQKMAARTTLFARMTADKFVVLLRYGTIAKLTAAVDRLHNKIKYFVHPVTGKYKLIYNFGIYLLKPQDTQINAALDKADIARRKANGSHASQFIFYNDEFRQNALREKEIEDMVDRALREGEFLIYYQPKVDLQTYKIKGAEALVRWKNSLKGFMPPNQFIPLFEKNGFIAKLDFYVFKAVYRKLRSWLDQGQPVVPIAVNFSRIHLSDREFIIQLIGLARKYNVPNHLIEIELTESMFMENVENLIQVMHKLKSLGFIISIDDFGSGYSSLRLLRDLPVDFLKLDKEFLDSGEQNDREKIVIENIIRMAKELGIKVVSEGVESEEQARFLKKCDCDLAQGFLFAKPMPVEEFEALLKAQYETN